jgi:hypothetical protein
MPNATPCDTRHMVPPQFTKYKINKKINNAAVSPRNAAEFSEILMFSNAVVKTPELC